MCDKIFRFVFFVAMCVIVTVALSDLITKIFTWMK